MTSFSGAPEPVTPEGPGLAGRPLMRQRWEDVVFLHWRVDPARVEPLLPIGTSADVFDGSSWVGLISFRLVGAGIGTGPAVPWLGTFAETNVRLYVVDRGGRRGVVFRSLDASRLVVVLGARLTFGLPYCWAKMAVRRVGADIEYTSTRRWPLGPGVRTHIVVRPEPVVVRDDPLAEFLTARWGLHTRRARRSLYVPNEHPTWPLQPAALQHLDDDLIAAAGLPGISDKEPDSVLWSLGVRTIFGVPVIADRGR